jgi:TonB family protein
VEAARAHLNPGIRLSGKSKWKRIIPPGVKGLLEFAQWREAATFSQRSPASRSLRSPRLAIERTGRLKEFASSLRVLFRGPAPPMQSGDATYFRDCWIEPRFPRAAFVAAIAIQALLIAYPPPIWNIRPASTISTAVQEELTWYGPAEDFPLLMPEVPQPKAKPRSEAPKALPPRAVEAFHPRQTILSEPLHPTHPRQALIVPRAPQEPPKILPALPNIVQLANSEPARPKLQLTSAELSVLRPKAAASLAASPVAAPDVSNPEKQTGVIEVASTSRTVPKPQLPVNPMSAPRAAAERTSADAVAPEVSGNADRTETLIALSAAPAPVAPPPVIPAGNLSARVTISPEGPQPGTTGAVASRSGVTDAGSGSGGHGPEGISITGGKAANSNAVAGLGIGPASRAAGIALPSRPMSRVSAAPEGPTPSSSEASAAVSPTDKLGLSPEKVLSGKRVYTLHVNMPNLTSASGSWILNFAELDEEPPSGHRKPEAQELAGLVPLRKVDPKYPPGLRASHVEGEVVLYAIIRKDGSVDSIQLVHSVDPLLDANAMEALAQWKFQPAERQGEPIDLEAVVRIPFRSRAPTF